MVAISEYDKAADEAARVSGKKQLPSALMVNLNKRYGQRADQVLPFASRDQDAKLPPPLKESMERFLGHCLHYSKADNRKRQLGPDWTPRWLQGNLRDDRLLEIRYLIINELFACLSKAADLTVPFRLSVARTAVKEGLVNAFTARTGAQFSDGIAQEMFAFVKRAVEYTKLLAG